MIWLYKKMMFLYRQLDFSFYIGPENAVVISGDIRGYDIQSIYIELYRACKCDTFNY
jgi:hypothetical protein